jgi:TIR domain
MAGIFISYRREDTAGYAGRLYDQLSAHFGEERVFMDVSDIEPGEDFAKAIETTIHTCDAAVVLIGKNWLTKRLDDSGDFVLLEITSALQRSIPVIPVLVDGTRMPAATELPQSLAPLCLRQAVELSNSMFREDVNRLIQSLDRVCRTQKKMAVAAAESLHAADQAKSKAKWMRLAAILVILISVVALFSFITHRSTHEKNIENQPHKVAPSNSPSEHKVDSGNLQSRSQPDRNPRAVHSKAVHPSSESKTATAEPSAAQPTPPEQPDASDGQQPQTVAPENGPSREEMESINARLIQLQARAEAVRSSLDRLRQQQAANGLGLRHDMAASANRLEGYLQAAERAIQNNTVQAARNNIDGADGELNKLEAFLGK